jgi:hypothetical protein
MKKILIVLVCLIGFYLQIFGQDTLRVMYYNILEYPLAPSSKAVYLKTIFDYYHPDVLVCDEVVSDAIAIDILNNVINVTPGNNYAKAVFTDGPDKDNMLFYNQSKFTMDYQTFIPTALRYINRYRLHYNAPAPDNINLDFYAAHLKASQGFEQDRYLECVEFENYIAANTTGQNIIFGGDLNLYTSTEPSYKLLLGQTIPPPVYSLFDPINTPGVWNNTAGFAPVHTQSTHFTTSGGFIGGGMDDRFDFMLISNDINTPSSNVHYLTNSYQALGNDGLHFNKNITDLPLSTTVPVNVTNALFDMSDHLPVVMKLLVTSSSLPEPTNHPGNFSATNIKLQWNDATGVSLPAGYLIRMSSVSFDAILPPVDGVAVTDGPTDKNVPYGRQEALFSNLTPNTIFYFKIYSYAGSGSNINYKIDGTIPQIQLKTTP